MHGVALVAAVVLSAVFLLSGVSKLAGWDRWIEQAGGLGVSRAVARIVPYVETVLGAVLLVQWHRRAVAWAAVAVLVAFTGVLVARLASGQRPPCACFGSLSSRPIGAWHVARNLAFVTLGVLAALG